MKTKYIDGQEDQNPESYSIEFSSVSQATWAAKRARIALDDYKNGVIRYKDFLGFPLGFGKLVILVTENDEYWIEVINEEENLYGVASFSPYTCHTEKHELTKDEALSEIHEVANKILEGKLE